MENLNYRMWVGVHDNSLGNIYGEHIMNDVHTVENIVEQGVLVDELLEIIMDELYDAEPTRHEQNGNKP